MSAFIKNNRDIEEEEETLEDSISYEKDRRDSDNFQMPILNDVDKAKLTSCIDEVRNVVGDQISERRIVETSISFGYDITKILDDILNNECDSKPKRHKSVSGSSTSKNQMLQPTTSSATKQKTPDREIAPNVNIPPTIKVTAQPLSERDIRRGFEVNSPQQQLSPAVSGRNTPVDEDVNKTIISIKVSKEQSQRDARKLYAQERGEQKAHFHMIVIGHVDAGMYPYSTRILVYRTTIYYNYSLISYIGKSTLMGHLLVDTGYVSQRVMHKHEQESKKMGKQSFMYAWVLDETGEERSRGMVIQYEINCFIVINNLLF